MSEASGNSLLDALRTELSKNSKIHAWQIRNVRQSGLQTYLVKTQLESERHSQDEQYDVAVFVKNGDLLGRAAITLAPADEGNLSGRVDEAVYMAGLGGDAPWQLPGAETVPEVRTFDDALAGEKVLDTSRKIVEEWRSAVSRLEGVSPSSMELFCRSAWTTFENSAGFRAQSSSTRVSLLMILLASDGPRAAESRAWEERRRASDLDVDAIVRDGAEEARDLTRTELPPSGEYPVVIDARQIPALFSPIRANAGAGGMYRKSSRFEIGEALPIEGTGGEPLTVISNALMPFGLSSYAFDGDGVPGQRIEIVKDGVFTHPWATKQFADYLSIQATGGFANWEVPPGTTPLADLLANEGGPVLYVRDFSWLTPDQARGDFSSEVRVGYLYENGERRPVKGGAVSGNLFRALGGARYASDSVFLGNYQGPAGIRVEGASIAAG